jgi:hypothetical protein
MYKLVILIHPLEDWLKFEDGWPDFLEAAEAMPGLVRETASRIDRVIYGQYEAALMHELFFEDMETLKAGFNSVEGQHTGQVLQRITNGQFTLLMAQHLEDELANLRAEIHVAENGADEDDEALAIPPGDKA